MCLAGCLGWLAFPRTHAWGQQIANPNSLPRPEAIQTLPPSSPTTRFATPRETLKTLYFSIIAYDFHPALIDDAIACLELGTERARTLDEAARLAIELDAILRQLCLPVDGLPESLSENKLVLYDGDGFKIALSRQADGRWCFDRETVNRIPAMYWLASNHHRDLQALRSGLRDGFTDPAATLRTFLVNGMSQDYYTAAQALDLSQLPIDQRSERGPILAQQLLFVMQRRGWVYFQEIPNHPEGPPYTWHVDRDGRIVLERVRLPDGKDAWLFSKRTVKNLQNMYRAALKKEPDPHYVQLKRVIPPITTEDSAAGAESPSAVPAQLGSPRAALKGFFRTMDEAEMDSSKLPEALVYLDLEFMPAADRPVAGVKLAGKLDAVLRKLAVDHDSVPDSWNAPPQVLGKGRNIRVELARKRDAGWRFSRATIEQLPQLFDQLAAQEQADRKRTGHLESARDTMGFFLAASNHHDDTRAARCLDVGEIRSSIRAEAGSVLAFKLRYLIDRTSAVYPQEIPDEPDGPRYIFHSSDTGRIVIARKTEGPLKGKWLFTADTVDQIEPMFLSVLGQPPDESLRNATNAAREPTLWETPGIWLRLRVPTLARASAGGLALYQWAGLVLTLVLSWVAVKLSLSGLEQAGVWVLRRSGSALTASYIAAKLRPLTWVGTCWLFFKFPAWLDLPVTWLETILPARTFLMAGLLGWLGFQTTDLLMALYMNSELLRPHRNLSDMIVPVCMRLFKGTVLLLVVGYVIYHVGEGQSLIRFLTGLGAAGLAASLAAQDILRSFFGTLLLIGECSFKLGDRIKVDGHEGVVEQVGFRSTRLRTSDGSLVSIPNATITSTSILRMDRGVEQAVVPSAAPGATELRRAG
jgi:MscS family membrane protein